MYFLDAFILLLVYYVHGADEAVPLPPPQDSQLWGLIGRIRKVGGVEGTSGSSSGVTSSVTSSNSSVTSSSSREPESQGRLHAQVV
jgi:hypothetical protein